jgi:hypothetical protein
LKFLRESSDFEGKGSFNHQIAPYSGNKGVQSCCVQTLSKSAIALQICAALVLRASIHFRLISENVKAYVVILELPMQKKSLHVSLTLNADSRCARCKLIKHKSK